MAGKTIGGEMPPNADALDANLAEPDADSWSQELAQQGFVVHDAAVPSALFAALQRRATELEYQPAQIGRATPKVVSNTRSDEIVWVNTASVVDAAWMRWLDQVQQAFNQRLFLGLRSVESHFARYAPGARYRRHRDAFASQPTGLGIPAATGSNRVVSLVLYLNQFWPADAKGQLLLYQEDAASAVASIAPLPNRLVLFMSTQVPHEVLPATQHRYSLAAWFRA